MPMVTGPVELVRGHEKRFRERRQIDDLSKASPVHFQSLVEESVDVICQVTQMAGSTMRYDYVSPSALEVVGWTAEEMMRLTHAELYPPESLATIREAGRRLNAGATSTVVTIEAIRKDGARIWLENRVRTLATDSHGNRTVVVCMRDVTTRKELQDQLTEMALVDALTGVGNRRAFNVALDREWEAAVQHQKALSLMLIDVDSFKTINDTHGHQVGDECIRLVSRNLCRMIEAPEALVARYGGDELAVLIPGFKGVEAHDLAMAVCQGIRSAAILLAANVQSVRPLTISCGVSTMLGSSGFDAVQTPGSLVRAADTALYVAKCRGRNRAEAMTLLEALGPHIEEPAVDGKPACDLATTAPRSTTNVSRADD